MTRASVRFAATGAAVCLVVTGCTSDADPDASDMPSPPSASVATDASTEEAGSATSAATSTMPMEGADSPDTGVTPASPAPPTPAGPLATPADISQPEGFSAVLNRLFALELPIREELAQRASDGDSLDDIDAIAELFADTRTPDGAVAEATAIAEFGGENLAAFASNGVRVPATSDVEVEENRSDCVVGTMTVDLIPTYNDEGQTALRFRLVAGDSNDSGWLFDEVSTGEVSSC